MNKYDQWIQENVKDDGYGQCKEITAKMAEAFPELTRVRGHYYCSWWGERAHWWLRNNEGIIDPTSAQFPSRGTGKYVEWIEGTPEPIGRCRECGEESFYEKDFCCENHKVAFITSLNYCGRS